MRSWSGRYGRSKVLEVFRRLRDGDPVEIEKNVRCSSDNLVVSSMTLQALLVAGKEMFVQGWLRWEILTSAFNSVRRWPVVCFMQTPDRNGKKTAWVALAVNGEDNLSTWLFFFFSRGSLFAITGMLLFMRQIFRIFKIFRGAAPNPAWGLTAPPRPPAGLRDASRPAAQSAACTLFSKNLSQTTLGPRPATPLSSSLYFYFYFFIYFQFLFIWLVLLSKQLLNFSLL